MRSSTLVMLGLAVVVGAVAIVSGKIWLDRQSAMRLREMRAQSGPAPASRTIVVAAMPLRYGTEIARQHLREVRWAEGEVPKGAFAHIDDLLDGKTRRVALAPMDEFEPVLKNKVTGPGQRASLTALIEPGMKAVAVRVNDINGVAGFILPGERVDVMLTRTLDKGDAFTDVLLQNVRVLAVDQTADERADKPVLSKAVTIEVATGDAQKLSLAATVGSLSLALRAAGETASEVAGRVTVESLTSPPPAPRPALASTVATVRPVVADARRTLTVGVTRGLKRQEYSIPSASSPEEQTVVTATTIGAVQP